MPCKTQVSKLLLCVWCKCLYPSTHVGVRPCKCISPSRHSTEGCVCILPPESVCMTTQCQLIQPQVLPSPTVVEPRIPGVDLGLPTIPKSPVETLRGVLLLLLLIQFLQKHWGNVVDHAMLPSDSDHTPRQCGEPTGESAMTQETAYSWIWASEKPGFRHQLCQLLVG